MRQIILLAAFEALFLINYSIQKKSDSVIGMIGKDRYCEITVGEAYRLISAQEVMVDIRTREDYDGGHRENAITVSHKIIRDEIPEALPGKKTELLVYCRSGRHNKKPAEKLRKPGYQSVYAFGVAIDWPHAFVKEG